MNDEALGAFFAEATALFAAMDEPDVEARDRALHTLKGTAAMLGLDAMAGACDALESASGAEAAVARARLAAEWDRVSTRCATLEAPVAPESPVARMQAIGEHAARLARRLGKRVEVEVVPTSPGVASPGAAFWRIAPHLVQNAVDHGVETPETRRALGKRETGRVTMELTRAGDDLLFRFADDGAGIDWSRLASKAAERGLPAETHADRVSALFAPGVSTLDASTGTSGRGLGLAAVGEYVRMLGGSAEVTSAPGAGTSWLFRFSAGRQ